MRMTYFGLVALLVACEVGSKMPAPRPTSDREPDIVDPETLALGRLEPQGHVGVIAASESVEVPSRIDGIIASVTVGIGDTVAEGDPIAKIDERPMREELAIARANERASAAQARRAGATLRAARNSQERREKLGRDILSAEDIEGSRTDAEKAAASRSEAGAIAAAEKTRVAQLERQLEETTITAPFAGKISMAYIGPGESVVRGTPIVRLITADELRVDFVFPLADQALYAIGDEILISIEGASEPIRGIIRRIAPDLDPVAQMIIAQAELKLPAEARKRIQAGMAVTVAPAQAKPTPPDQLN